MKTWGWNQEHTVHAEIIGSCCMIHMFLRLWGFFFAVFEVYCLQTDYSARSEVREFKMHRERNIGYDQDILMSAWWAQVSHLPTFALKPPSEVTNRVFKLIDLEALESMARQTQINTFQSKAKLLNQLLLFYNPKILFIIYYFSPKLYFQVRLG